MVIPNCVWKAGRVASAVRTTAISCLWALLEGSALSKEKVCIFYLVVIFTVNNENLLNCMVLCSRRNSYKPLDAPFSWQKFKKIS